MRGGVYTWSEIKRAGIMCKHGMQYVGVLLLVLVLGACGAVEDGELRGVPGREFRAEPEPYNMVRIPRGAFTMGSNDEDVTWAHRAPARTVTIEAFWMDATEISNNQYRQFVYWVRDSLMRRLILDRGDDEFGISEDEFGQPIEPPRLNWDVPIDLKDEEQYEAVQSLYYDPENDQFEGRKEIDTRKLMYKFYWIDLAQAAHRKNRYNFYLGEEGGYEDDAQVFYFPTGRYVEVNRRKDFIIEDRVNVYPDTLAWISDWSYAFHEPMAMNYFWHPGYDNYPVVGVTWRQAFAFCIWRSDLLNRALVRNGENTVHSFRLPTEAEWEYAARGGLNSGMYPWGSYYTRSAEGCFLANFKPMRGRYAEDGGATTLPVDHFEPNEYGLYNMSGNVAEWTCSAYDESSYYFTHDMNPDYRYNAKPDDPPAMKRKVIRGGSWKDVHYFTQVATRSFEYQDSAKTYIGFRCVRSCLMGDDIR